MKKIIFSFAFLLIQFSPLFAESAYFIYDTPPDYTEQEAHNLMLEENKFTVNGGLVDFPYNSYEGDYLSQYGPKVSLRAHDGTLFRGVPLHDSQDIVKLNKVFLIDGPANIRITPPLPKGKGKDFAFSDRNAWKNPKKWNGAVIGSMADNTMIAAAYKYDDWYFVYDADRNAGWTQGKNLKPIPAGKMYFYNKIDNAPQYFASWKEAEKYDTNKIFDMFNPNSIESRGMTIEDVCFGDDCKSQPTNKSNNLPAGKKPEDFCPKFITPSEKDGFISTTLPFDTSAKKSYIWRYCHGQDPNHYVSPSRPVTDVKMKTDKCICLDGAWFEEPEYVVFTKDEPFYNIDEHGNRTYDCIEEENTILCNISCEAEDGGCEACDPTEVCNRGGPQKICPKECMEWQLVTSPVGPAKGGI